MSYERPGLEVGFLPADVDMSAMQYLPVWVGPAQNVNGQGIGGAALVLKGSNTAAPFGVLQNTPRQGAPGNVMQDGVTKCVVNGAVAVGDALGTDANGKVVKAAGGTTAFGRALESGTAGSIIACKLEKTTA